MTSPESPKKPELSEEALEQAAVEAIHQGQPEVLLTVLIARLKLPDMHLWLPELFTGVALDIKIGYPPESNQSVRAGRTLPDRMYEKTDRKVLVDATNEMEELADFFEYLGMDADIQKPTAGELNRKRHELIGILESKKKELLLLQARRLDALRNKSI